MPEAKPSDFGRVWKAPIMLGLLSAFGLLSALVGHGFWHWAAWAALAAPILAILCCVARKKK
ncbi:MAG TPA: hypothetical protein VNZ68_02175 [Rhodocyclaceae bacterium]|nr:hypothetical protein [Rhodocyclaceae bacterium]